MERITKLKREASLEIEKDETAVITTRGRRDGRSPSLRQRERVFHILSMVPEGLVRMVTATETMSASPDGCRKHEDTLERVSLFQPKLYTLYGHRKFL
jgi:hypothetical protein